MEIKINHLTLDERKRILCISDIHGNFLYLQKLLELLHYQPGNDYLFILGDLIEKGKESLRVVRYLMSLPDTYVLMGNCEYFRIQVFLKNKDYLSSLRFILNQTTYPSIFKEMAMELQLNTEAMSDEEIIDAFWQNYPAEIQFLISLPHVLEHEKIRFVHAGTMEEEIHKNALLDILTIQNFHQLCKPMHKWCVVGHYPTVNYSQKIPSFNPIIDKKKKVISIDGGNVVTPYGQLNGLIISSLKEMHFSFRSYEQKINLIVPYDQQESKDAFYLPFSDAEVTIMEEIDDHTVWVKTRQHYFAVDKKEISTYHGKTYVFDYTNYYLSVRKLDKVILYKQTPYAYLVKKDGILGWIKKENHHE